MKLTIAKRIAYVVLGALIIFVFVFNPIIVEWWSPKVLMVKETIGRGPASGGAAPEQQIINYYSSIFVPLALYGGKRVIDWFFEYIMPHKEVA